MKFLSNDYTNLNTNPKRPSRRLAWLTLATGKKKIKCCLQVGFEHGVSNVDDLNDDSQHANYLIYCYLYNIKPNISIRLNDADVGPLVFQDRRPTSGR